MVQSRIRDYNNSRIESLEYEADAEHRAMQCYNFYMINFRNEAELSEILKEFDVPKLVYKGKYNAGPDEELYFFETEDGDKYGIWSRDYMSELKYETNGLKNNYNIKIKKWVMTKDGDETAYYRGDYFALFKM